MLDSEFIALLSQVPGEDLVCHESTSLELAIENACCIEEAAGRGNIFFSIEKSGVETYPKSAGGGQHYYNMVIACGDAQALLAYGEKRK